MSFTLVQLWKMMLFSHINLKVLLLLMVHFGLAAKVINAKIAFLYREQKQDIYMEYTPSMKDVGKDNCLIMQKNSYSLIQAAW